tara:strand:+ start:100 stop:312 length:213 start_codon:yes stop_codon:yes gene_type:complete
LLRKQLRAGTSSPRHLVAQRLFDFSSDLSSLGAREGQFSLTHGMGDPDRRGWTQESGSSGSLQFFSRQGS